MERYQVFHDMISNYSNGVLLEFLTWVHKAVKLSKWNTIICSCLFLVYNQPKQLIRRNMDIKLTKIRPT